MTIIWLTPTRIAKPGYETWVVSPPVCLTNLDIEWGWLLLQWVLGSTLDSCDGWKSFHFTKVIRSFLVRPDGMQIACRYGWARRLGKRLKKIPTVCLVPVHTITNRLGAHNSDLVTILFTVVFIRMLQSSHNFAHVTTALLSWHGQKCDLTIRLCTPRTYIELMCS